MTAEELNAYLAELRETDAEYRAEVEVVDEQLRAKHAMLTEAEQPIVADLAEAGFQVESVWDLVNTAEPYPEALPVLLEHLERGGYPDQVLEGLARALAVPDAAEYWDRLRELYQRALWDSAEEEGLAVALAATVTPERMDALIDLTLDHTRSDNRLLFLRAIKRHGGQRGRDLLESLTNDPALGKQARALLKKPRRRPR